MRTVGACTDIIKGFSQKHYAPLPFRAIGGWCANRFNQLLHIADNLNTAHKIGWIEHPKAWVELHRIRNTVVHEYLDDPEFMAAQTEQAAPLVG